MKINFFARFWVFNKIIYFISTISDFVTFSH